MTQLALPLALADVHVEPTIAVLDGRARLAQCATCGVAICVPDSQLSSYRHDDPLGACPRCAGGVWWRQGDHVGPFHLDGPDSATIAASREVVRHWRKERERAAVLIAHTCTRTGAHTRCRNVHGETWERNEQCTAGEVA